MQTVQALLRSARDLPGDSPLRDAEVLLAHCLCKSRTWLYTWPDAPVEGAPLTAFNALLQRRREGEPVAHLVGHREFWSLDLAVSPGTLIPRPDTETLIEWALELPLPDTARVLDLGTGTGAIALALASERSRWQVCGVDVIEEAVLLARQNAVRCGLERVDFRQADWFSAAAAERLHLVVSNPPYIDATDAHLQRGDLRFEPRSALVASDRGMADIATIISQAPDHLVEHGWLLLEHGYEQGPSVQALLTARGFTGVSTRRDLAGRERISGGQWCAD